MMTMMLSPIFTFEYNITDDMHILVHTYTYNHILPLETTALVMTKTSLSNIELQL